jgi:hypothetical protein
LFLCTHPGTNEVFHFFYHWILGLCRDNITKNVDFRPWLYANGTVNQSSFSTEEEKTEFNHYLYLGATVSVLLLGALIIIISEPICYSFFRHVSPSYTRLDREKIDNDIAHETVREQIYLYVNKNPGVNFTRIRKDLDMGTGTVVYHLSMLERKNFLRSSETGRKKRFWTKTDSPDTGNS